MNMRYLFWILAGYLSGSVLFAYWLPRLLYHVDICQESSDGNPGTFNVFQQCGAMMGTLVLLLELGKGVLPVSMAAGRLDMEQWPFALVLAAPVIGHAFPVWHHFKGGKSIAVSFGVLLGLCPICLPVFLLAGCYLLFSLVIVINPHALRSIATFGLWAAGCHRMVEIRAIYLGCCLIGLVVIGKHLAAYQGEKLKLELLHQKIHFR